MEMEIIQIFRSRPFLTFQDTLRLEQPNRVHINTNHGFQNFSFVGVKLCAVHLPTAHMIPGDLCSEALAKVQMPVLRKPGDSPFSC